MQFVVRDGSGIARHKTAFAKIVEGNRTDFRVPCLVVVDEILKLMGFLRNQGAAASQAVNPKLIQILRTLVIEW